MTDASAKRRSSLPKPLQVSIFTRDKWLCRWCGKPVIFAPVMKFVEIDVKMSGYDKPTAYYHAHWTRATAPLLDELGAVLDHAASFSSGGPCDIDNLVTACNKCNGRKNSAPLDAWGQREIRKPIKGKYGDPTEWDGMSSLFVILAERYPLELTAGERAWLKALRNSAIKTEM